MNKLQIDFEEFFASINDQPYVVIKLDPQFPNYTPGQDIDIFCRDIEEISRRTIGFLSQFANDKFFIAVNKRKDRFHIDLVEENEIHFRFDLLGALPKYQHVAIKSSLFDVVIEASTERDIGGLSVKVANETDEAVLRYIEYLEYIFRRPDKVKHCEWIINKSSGSPGFDEKFFTRFHHFLLIPSPVDPKKASYLTRCSDGLLYFRDNVKRGFTVFKQEGVSMFLAKVKKRLFG